MSKAESVIRHYSSADWTAVCRIHDAARMQELTAGHVDPRAFRPMTEAAAGDEFFLSQTLVACLAEEVVGFASWNGPYISWLYVDPAVQRSGIGRQLLQAALQGAGDQAWTNMLAGNDAALSLYLKAGMEVVWTRPSECDGFPCHAMRLALPTSWMHDPLAKRSDRPIVDAK